MRKTKDHQTKNHILIILALLSTDENFVYGLSNSYTMGCPPVCGDNPQALNCEWIKHGITILYHLHV